MSSAQIIAFFEAHQGSRINAEIIIAESHEIGNTPATRRREESALRIRIVRSSNNNRWLSLNKTSDPLRFRRASGKMYDRSELACRLPSWPSGVSSFLKSPLIVKPPRFIRIAFRSAGCSEHRKQSLMVIYFTSLSIFLMQHFYANKLFGVL